MGKLKELSNRATPLDLKSRVGGIVDVANDYRDIRLDQTLMD